MKKTIHVGKIAIGGDSAISVQSMLNCASSDFEACSEQIRLLKAAGCDIVRMAICDETEVACAARLLKEFCDVPLVADIQFDYKLAIRCSDAGFQKVRINPGNIGGKDKVKAVADACRANGTAIRVGVNSGSLEKDLLDKYGAGARALCESTLRNAALLEKCGFDNIVLSAKSSDVKTMIETYRLLDKASDYPLHLGVTESGSVGMGNVKSAIGIGALLADGIGDTVRVSLTGNPVREIHAAFDILRALHLKNYCEIVSCPTCSRCHYPLDSLVEEITLLTKDVQKKIKIAIMGCVVNGPGEARDADLGIAGGKDKAVIFEKGNVLKTLPYDKAVAEFKAMVGGLIADVYR